ncbi:MAG: hypothetical protein IT537_18470 [Hyphomicrobiales bacterium]|nr:hypothetical protein [Hyphomicrobiales bacterium]
MRRAAGYWLCTALVALPGIVMTQTPPAQAQPACTTNYCISAKPVSIATPAGWPSVTVEPCCRTNWGSRPSNIDWSNGAPVMICVGNGEYADSFPNCGDAGNAALPFPLSYERPTIGIGVAWPSAKDYRYELQSVPIVDGPDGSCAPFAKEPGKAASWWVHELKDPIRGVYTFSAQVSFRQGERGYYAVMSNCRLAPPAGTATR